VQPEPNEPPPSPVASRYRRRRRRRRRRRQLCVVDRPASGENLLLRAENQRERSLGGRERQSYGLNAPRDDDGGGRGKGARVKRAARGAAFPVRSPRPPRSTCTESLLLSRFFPFLRDPTEGGWCLLSAFRSARFDLRDAGFSRIVKREPVTGSRDGMSKENDGRAISSFSEDDAARPTSGAAEDRNVALRKYARMRAEVPRSGRGRKGEGEGR